MHGRFVATVALGLAVAGTALAREDGTASQFIPVMNEPPAELFLDPPLPGPLARGAVIVPYRTRNFRILPVFGTSALDVSPRAGHLHVSVDDLPWRWADAGNTGSVVVNGLPAGPHKLLIELAQPDHKVIAAESVSFVVPATPASPPADHAHPPAGHQPTR
ncbi:DUF6130 family protein [Lysobacter sp. LF1]|uniref:DUF6130 family protein n=1 Tax=Lysobacter stagni TaxID=3045172 RepID=A0ABT6XJ20_9GAMM|nr:DUF6130 family protein [Lysobacter sp. LF1]MDI9240161.1 DUF6130 family protein [Lysobacter sp. LF1]